MATVLILDDEPVIREVLGSVLAKAGHATREAATAAEGLARLEKEPIDLLLLDLMLPDRPGLEVLVEVRARHPEIPVVVVTAYSSVESAITAMREGAFHYIPKPFRNEEVVHVVRQALEKRQLVAENRALRAKLDAPGGFRELVGRSASMERVYETVRQAAAARSTILVTGESGTGKELVAKALHRQSPRAAGPVRDRPLGRASARPPRVESLRARPRLVHGSRRGQEGPVQGRRRRHDLLRRDRDRPARHAGQAPARPAGARVHARGRRGAASGPTCA